MEISSEAAPLAAAHAIIDVTTQTFMADVIEASQATAWLCWIYGRSGAARASN